MNSNTAKQIKPRLLKSKTKEALTAYLFITPFFAGLSIFYFYAFFQNFYISFTNKKSFGDPKFIGLTNYIKLFKDDKFYSALSNTIGYVLICVPGVIILSILVAVLLNQNTRLKSIYRTLIFIPAVTMPAAIGLVWKWMMNYEFGLFNGILNTFGIESTAWLSDTKFALLSVSIVLIWSDVSLRMIVLLAGLQGIPKTYYEAAQIDGAGPFTRFFKITLPLLSPTIFFVGLMELIGVFQIFDFIYLMIHNQSSGMPAARSLVSLFYDEGFRAFHKGYAAAISMVLFFIILIITIVQMVLRKRWVYEE